MPPFKQPSSLQDLSKHSITTCIKKVCQEDLHTTPTTTLKKWEELHRFLFFVLPINLGNFIAIQGLTALAKMPLYSYHEKLVEKMVTACLHSGLSELNISQLHMNPLQEILWRKLPEMSKLQYIIVSMNELVDQSCFQISLPLRLPKYLVSFTMRVRCTDEIMSVLGQCCQQLEYLDITWSISVTDAGIQHISGLKKLKEVLLMGTSVTVQGFQFLIEEVKGLVHFESHNLTTKLTKKLTETNPSLKSVSISMFESDISVLKELKFIQELNLSKCDFSVVNGVEFLKAKGSSLKTLNLCTVSNISVSIIGKFCKNLTTLKMYQCTPSEETSLPGETFQTLEEISYSPKCSATYLECFLTSSKNIRRVVITVASGVDDSFIRNILVKNSLDKLQELKVSGPGISCSMSSVYLIMQRCLVLTNLGNLGHWRGLTKEEVDGLRKDLKQRNLNLTIFFKYPASVDLFK